MSYSFRMKSIISILVVVALVCWNLPLQASERAHEHGVGTLSIAVEGNEVEIELNVPGSDVVGFEHVPTSESERQEVMKGVKTLRAVNGIINLSSEANCRVEEIEVSSGLMEDQKDDHGDSHKHKHEAKDHDDHKEGDKDNEKEVHAEFIAHYHFHCDNPKKLTGADVNFFKTFPSAHELEVKWITPRGQGAAELTAKSPKFTF